MAIIMPGTAMQAALVLVACWMPEEVVEVSNKRGVFASKAGPKPRISKPSCVVHFIRRRRDLVAVCKRESTFGDAGRGDQSLTPPLTRGSDLPGAESLTLSFAVGSFPTRDLSTLYMYIHLVAVHP